MRVRGRGRRSWNLPPSPEREVILTVCYGVVIFSIIVQGLTMERLVRRVVPSADPPEVA